MAVWIPKSLEESKKRHAGRRKLHIKRRSARAERIRELLSDMLGQQWESEMLRHGEYGATSLTAEGFEVSLATASRDLAICRRILAEFRELFGREFDPSSDEIVWTWDYANYSFQIGGKRVKGARRFPFSTRVSPYAAHQE